MLFKSLDFFVTVDSILTQIPEYGYKGNDQTVDMYTGDASLCEIQDKNYCSGCEYSDI